MESRESQRDKRVQDVLRGRPSGGGDSPTASAMRAREEIQGIEAERSANLEREKIIGTTRQQQMATMKQAALLGASGMAASDAPAQVSPLAQQAAAMNPQTQAILQKYGVKPGPRTTVSTTQTSGPNIRTTNTTNNNVRNEIKIVQPQIPMRQQVTVGAQGKSGNLDKFKAWLDSSFAKQANEYEVQQKEYRKREWNLARNSSKLFQKLSESTKSLGEKMDPRNMGSTFGGQLKTLLFLFLATTIDKWWNPLMKKIASFEAGFRAVFGIPVNAELERGGAEGLSFVNKIKEFIGIDTKTEKGKATSLLGGIREVFSDGITRLIDTLKLFIEDRRIALQKINMPDFKMPSTDFNPLGNMINSAFKGVMAPATEYLGNILSALMGGSSAVARKAANSVTSTAKTNFKHSYGGKYFTSESTDFMGNLKDDSTYGMSEMLTRNLTTRDNVLRTGGLMTGLKMLEGNAQKSGGAVINPELLTRLGIGPDVISKMVASGQAQYVPYKIIMVPKTAAESEEYTGGSWGSYVGNELLDNLTFGIYGKLSGWGAKKAATQGMRLAGKVGNKGLVGAGRAIAGASKLAGAVGKWAGPAGWAATIGGGLAEGTYDYLQASRDNSSIVAKAVPESDPRPGTPIRLLKITPAGFNTIKSQHGIKSFDPTDRNFRTWLEGQERNQKAIMGVRGKMVYEDQAGMSALDKGQTMAAAYDARMDEIWNRDGAWKRTADNTRRVTANVTQWVGSKINVLASGVSGNPSYARRNTIHNLYQTLKAALDEKRRDLPEDKREAFARLMAAQAMHESGGKYPGGISKLAYEANNYGGVIATKGRPVYYLDNGTISKWSKFNDMQDWANYQVGLLNGSRYKTFDADPSDYVSILKQGGYFGDGDEGAYATAVQKHLGNVNSVVGSYQYTSFTPSESMTAVTPPPTGAISLGADLSGNNIKGCSPESVKDAKLKNILRSRNTGKFYSTSRGWLLLGFNNYRSLCTAGPSTFYEAGGFNAIRGSWWNTGSPYTATSTRIGGTGLKKIWNGSLGQIDSMGSGQLKPGDIGILFGKHKDGSPSAHGMMWDGNHWVSDTVQSHGACYSTGRLGNQSAQIWRMPEFWPDDFGGGDEKESGAETTYIDSNGEIYNGTFMGAAGNVAGQVIGSMGAAVTGAAQSMMSKGSPATTGYNPAALSASQKATIEWMKRNGAIEDESGLYIYDEATKTRSYLDLNSGISKTGNITRANIMAVAHMGENGTIDSYETDSEAIDAYKDRAIGKLLNIQISNGKSPDSIQTDIYIGEFSDYNNFSEPAKKYINDSLGGLIRYNLYEVLSDGTGFSSILVPRIPLLDDSGWPVWTNYHDHGTYDYQYGPGDLGVVKDGEKSNYLNRGLRQGWTYLFKKSGFKYKKLASDLSETVSDFHPYLHGTLKVSITPYAMRVINGLMAYIRGELEDNDLKEEFGLSLNKDKADKIRGMRDKILEVGADKAREAMFGTADHDKQVKLIDKSIEDWKSGKNKDNYVTYNLDDGRSYVIDKTLGIKIAESADKNAPMVALGNKTIFDQKNEDYNTYLRQADLVQGKLNVDIESLYKRYMENDLRNLSDSNVRREFIKRLMGNSGEVIKDKAGKEWIPEVDNTGKIRYKFNYNPEADSDLLNKNGIAKKLLEKYGISTKDTKAIQKKLWEEGISGADFNEIFGGNVRENGPDWNNLDDVRKYFSGIEDVSNIWRNSKNFLTLKDAWLKENSESRVLADALVAKYNKNHGEDTDELYNSNGTLVYRDDLGMVHAIGKVSEEEGQHFASSFDKSDEGASQYARANEVFKDLNLGTEAGQAALEAEYASRFGAKSLGNGLMYFEHDGNRVVFNVNDVKDHADIKKILNHENTKFYTKAGWSTSKEQDQKANAIFREEGWSELRGKYSTYAGSGMYGTVQRVEMDDTLRPKTDLAKAMEEAEKNPKEKTDLERFTDSYKEALTNISQERLGKIESGNINEKLEGHAGNIEDYTKRSAEYLEIIAGATKMTDAQKEKYESLVNRGLPMTQSELRANMGPVTKDQVDKVTADVQKNTKEYFIKALVPAMQELAKSNPKLSEKAIFEAAKKQVLGMPEMRNNMEGKMMGYGNWSKGVIVETRKKQEEAEAKKLENVKAEGANIKAQEKLQETEASIVKSKSETSRIEEQNAKIIEGITPKIDESTTKLLSFAETMQSMQEQNKLAGGWGFNDQKVINNNEGANVNISIYNNSPNASSFIMRQGETTSR